MAGHERCRPRAPAPHHLRVARRQGARASPSLARPENRPRSTPRRAFVCFQVPNIAGLVRTAEVFAADRLVIDDLRVMSHHAFKAIAATAEAHVPIEAVPTDQLRAWLRARARELADRRARAMRRFCAARPGARSRRMVRRAKPPTHPPSPARSLTSRRASRTLRRRWCSCWAENARACRAAPRRSRRAHRDPPAGRRAVSQRPRQRGDRDLGMAGNRRSLELRWRIASARCEDEGEAASGLWPVLVR